jgi:uroporphyrinogen-III synthase
MSRFVLITRNRADCAELQNLLDPCGMTLRPYPVLRLEAVDDEEGWQAVLAAELTRQAGDRLVFASPRAPKLFIERCREHEADHLLDLAAAAVGPSTARAAEDAGAPVDLVGPGNGAGLAEMIIEESNAPTTVVFACGRERRPELPATLEAAGHRVLPVEVYRMQPTPPRELPPLGPSLEAVVLTSPRSARLYLDGVGGLPLPCQHWALGPTTRDAAAGMGIECRIPEHPTMKSLAEELCKI